MVDHPHIQAETITIGRDGLITKLHSVIFEFLYLLCGAYYEPPVRNRPVQCPLGFGGGCYCSRKVMRWCSEGPWAAIAAR